MSRFLSAAILLFPAVATAAPATPPAVTAVAYSPNGERVAFGLAGEVRTFDAAKGTVVGKPVAVSGRVTALTFDPKGRWLAVASGEAGKSGRVYLHPLGNSPKVEVSAHKDAIYALAFSPDGQTLATTGYDRVIHLWDTPDNPGEAKGPRLTLKDHSDAVYGLSFHPDGKLLASASADRAVKVWEVATGKRLYTLSDPTDWVYAVAWSPDRKHLAAAGVDKSVRVWAADADGGKLVNTAFAHEKPVWRLAYTADGKTLYTAGEDRSVKSWDALKLTELKVYDTQPDSILDFSLRRDGKQFALARFDGAGILIDPTTGKLVAELLPLEAAAKGKPGESPVLAQQPKAAPPKVEKLTPNGGIRGKTTRVTVTGANLESATSAAANSPDVMVEIADAKRTTNSLELDVIIDEAAPVGAVQITLEGRSGKSAPVTFAVDRFVAVPESGATDSARTAMTVKLPATVVGTIDRAGDVDYFRFKAGAGDQIGVQVTASELGSKLDPALTLTDEGGNVLAEGAATLGYVVRKGGTYAVGIRDREFRGASDFTYRLQVGDVPVVTGVFPLAVQRGRTSSVHVTGVNLAPGASGVTAKVTVPADAQPGSKVPVPLKGAAAEAVGSASIMVSEFPAVVLDPVTGGDIHVPGSADGIFTKPNSSQIAHFSAKKGERLIVEVLAQRADSPVDSVIEVLDSAGKPVPLATLRCTAKTSVTFRDHDSRGPGIRLDAWNELAVDDYLFVNGELVRILALPKGPDDDAQFYQVGGQRIGFLGTTPIHHSFGETMYKVEIHPPGKKFPPNGMPVFNLSYRNDDGGPGYGKDSRLFFDPPADGTYQVRVTDARGAFGPTHAFRVTVRPPKPDFTMTANVVGPALLNGGAIPVNVTINRLDGFNGTVTVRWGDDERPDGFHLPATYIEAGHNTATLALYLEPGAKLPEKLTFALEAEEYPAADWKKPLKRTVTLALPGKINTGDIVTTVKAPTIEKPVVLTLPLDQITIRPGKETRFTVSIERQGKFAGRVPLEVKNLPHGVRVLNIGLNGILVTERETSREVVLYAEPWVQPLGRPILVVAKREGTSAEFGAKPFLLEVKK